MSHGSDLFGLAKRNDVLDDKEVRKLVLAAGLSNNERFQESVGKAVLNKSIQQYQYPFKDSLEFGDIGLGSTFQNRPFYLSQEDLTKHLLAVGQSGSGKTTLFYSLMDEVDVPFWAFDLKQDYRHLAGEGDLLVLPWQEFRFNPLRGSVESLDGVEVVR